MPSIGGTQAWGGDSVRIEAELRGCGNPVATLFATRRDSGPGCSYRRKPTNTFAPEHGALPFPAHDAGMDILMAAPVIDFRGEDRPLERQAFAAGSRERSGPAVDHTFEPSGY